MRRGRVGPTSLHVEPPWQGLFRRAGIRGVADVLARAECVRDLPDRANLRLRVGPLLVHVKHRKRRWGRPAPQDVEGARVRWAASLGVPAPPLVFRGEDARLGAVAGTKDLAPARPLDDLLREGALAPAARLTAMIRLAIALARLHEAGAHHRDLYLNHVYADPALDDPLVAIIDWDRSGRHRFPYGRWVVKDLAALLSSIPPGSVTDREQVDFLVRYLGMRGRGVDASSRRLARRVARKAARMRAHVPRTPVGEAARPREGGRPA